VAGGLNSVLVNSDRTRTDGLFRVDTEEIIRIFSLVAADYPSESRMVFDHETGDYNVSLS
jgi:hypothetical protein